MRSTPKPASIASSCGLASFSANRRTMRARLVQRPRGADRDAAHVAVDPIERELDPPRALRLALEQHDEIVGELAQGRLDRLDRLHGRGEPPLGAEIRRGEARRDRGALEALELVEPRDRQRRRTAP